MGNVTHTVRPASQKYVRDKIRGSRRNKPKRVRGRGEYESRRLTKTGIRLGPAPNDSWVSGSIV